jgi:hypothetical protein
MGYWVQRASEAYSWRETVLFKIGADLVPAGSEAVLARTAEHGIGKLGGPEAGEADKPGLFLARVAVRSRMKHIGIYVSLFAIGHSTTMLLGVYFGWKVNSYLIDAIIGLSVVYKSLDNLGAFQRWLGFQPNTKVATLIFGFFHGFGLATKILDYEISPDGLVPNLLAFNVGVEIGQMLALGAILILMGYWRRTRSFWRHAYTTNVVMMTAGFLLVGYQITGLFTAS